MLSYLFPNQVEDFERTEPYICVHHYCKHQQFMFGQEYFPGYKADKDSYDNPCIHAFAKHQAFLCQMPLVCCHISGEPMFLTVSNPGQDNWHDKQWQG